MLERSSVLRPLGWRSSVAKILMKFGLNIRHVARVNPKCMYCGFLEAEFFPFATRADFNVRKLPEDVRWRFYSRSIGQCQHCGLVQDYSHLTENEIRSFLSAQGSNKDNSVSEEAYHTFPVPADYVESFNKNYFSIRTERWKSVLPDLSKLEDVLFFRPFFGASIDFVKEYSRAKCSALEISEVARKTVELKHPDVEFLNGNIHGLIFGDFVEVRKWDALFCFHTLCHSVDIRKMLQIMKSLVREGGFIVFSHETIFKPTNPFHNAFFDEDWFVELLQKNFSKVERVPFCEEKPSQAIACMTNDASACDYVAWV
ncbi:MAG: class I SAM-dependent methyltransferase [Pseudomonadota bacterium]|nr:class I SAM-dependent methyltransferase [Pseudomonadota bacterium]